jgi:hypothetical protein
MNVGSGGGAAAAPAAGGAAAASGGAAAEDAPKEAEKEEGECNNISRTGSTRDMLTTSCDLQRRRSRTRTWASVSSTKRINLQSRHHLDDQYARNEVAMQRGGDGTEDVSDTVACFRELQDYLAFQCRSLLRLSFLRPLDEVHLVSRTTYRIDRLSFPDTVTNSTRGQRGLPNSSSVPPCLLSAAAAAATATAAPPLQAR